MSLLTPPDWIGMENVIADLLPSPGATHDRKFLLAELSAYAGAVTREARRAGRLMPVANERARTLGWLDRPVFICGHYRSGTTLLQALLDGHPELLVLPSEGTYFTSFRYAMRATATSHDVDVFIAEWISRLVDPNEEPHFRLGRSRLEANPSILFARRLAGWHAALLEERPELASFALLLALVAAFAAATAASGAPSCWVEKTPLNEHHVKRLMTFEQARFIHLVRDPSATLASLLEIHRATGIRGFHPADQARAIGESLQLSQRNEERFKDRYLVVQYENLADDPISEMERVCAFLEISPSPSLLIPTAGGRAVRSNSSFGPGLEGVVHRSRTPPALPLKESRLIRAFAASAALPFRYELTPLTMPARVAIRLWQTASKVLRRLPVRIARLYFGSARCPT